MPIATFLPFKSSAPLIVGLATKMIIEFILQPEDHCEIPAASVGVGHMGPANQAHRHLSRQHRLHRSPGNDKYQVRIYAVLAKNALLLGNPQRRNVVADGAMRDQEL